MADALLAGVRLLVAGAEPGATVAALQAAGAEVLGTEAGVDATAERVRAERPDAVVALGALAAPLQHVLDPEGLATSVPVVAAADGAGSTPEAAALLAGQLAEAVARRRLSDRAAWLEATVLETATQQTRQLEDTRLDTLRRLSRIAEYRDDNSWEHTQRVAQLAARMGARLGVGRRTVELLRRTAPLHDIGKIAIPDTILLKPGKLTSYEYEVVKSHTVVGAQVLAQGDSDLVITAKEVVRSHHERWDGNGYPDGLAGEDIPLVARLVHVADVFDILVHERPHKEAWSLEDAAAEVARNAGSQFDPGVVEAFDALGSDVWRAPAPLRDASAL